MSLLRRIQGDNEEIPKTERPSRMVAPKAAAPYQEHKREMIARINAGLDPSLDKRSPEFRAALEMLLISILSEGETMLSRSERNNLLDAILADLIGFGPIDALLADDNITEIMVNSPQAVYVTRKGLSELTAVTFDDDAHVIRILERMLGYSLEGKPPIIEARFPGRSHLNIILPPLVDSPAFTITKYFDKTLQIEDLIRFGTLTPEVAEFLHACVVARLNILICGEGAAGKTTLLNALGRFIPSDERIITLENTPDLRLQGNVLSLKTSPDISTQQLLVQALHMKPDRLIIGDIHGSEALNLIEVMNSGWEGVLMTIHGKNPRDALHRLEIASSHTDLPLRALRAEIGFAIDMIVCISRLRDGSRKVTFITEVQGMEGDQLAMTDIFEFEQTGFEAGKIMGRIKPTGLRPRAMARLEDAGIQLPPAVFGVGRKTDDKPASPPSPAPAAQPAPEPAPVPTENVHFTMFHPKEAAAETWHTALVYTHLESALEQVQNDAQKFRDEMADDPREVYSRQPAQLARGTELQIVLEAEGIVFKPSTLTLKWEEDVERANFRFRASPDLIGQPCFGEMNVYVGPLQIAQCRFSIFITQGAKSLKAALQPENTTATTQMYQRIFASYSHRDTPIVDACAQAFKAIGYDVSVDYETLRSGEVWSEALKQMIDSADIFQLFWSPHSAISDYVKQEWEYALTKSGAGFIRPVYWKQPMPDVPAELAHLHFKFLPTLAR